LFLLLAEHRLTQKCIRAARKAVLDVDQSDGGSKPNLVAAVDKVISEIAGTLADKIEERICPYMPAVEVFEMIDPSCKDVDFAAKMNDDEIINEGIKLCKRFSQGKVGNEILTWESVVGQLVEIRIQFDGCTQSDTENCSKNLLRFYREWQNAGKMEPWSQAAEFIRCVFCCPITTVKVESMFSIMNYNKSGRLPLPDEL